MTNEGTKTVTFWNESGYTAKDIPDIDSERTLAGVSYFYLYFKYGDMSDALMEGDGWTITEKLQCQGWSIVKCSDAKIHTYWKLMPTQTIVWEAGSGKAQDAQVVVQFSGIQCNAALGDTDMRIQDETGAVHKIPIHKCPMPNVSDIRIVSSKPYYIGDKGKIGWRVENYGSFKVTLDGDVIVQAEDYHEETRNIRYGDYVIKVKNDAGTTAEGKISFPLEIIRLFEVVKLTPEQATFRWEVEDKNADTWEIKQIANNLPAKGEQTYDVATTADRDFQLSARVKGSSDWVESTVTFQMPVIKTFGKGTALEKKIDCCEILEKNEENGFLAQTLVLLAAEEPDICTSFYFSCKGGGGGTTYKHTYHWSGENVEKYYLKLDSGHQFGPYTADLTTATEETDSRNDEATLAARRKYMMWGVWREALRGVNARLHC